MDEFIILNSNTIDAHSTTVQNQFDQLGIESGKAQFLTAPITSAEKLRCTDSSAAVVWTVDSIPVGFAKYGFKDLYVYTKQGKVLECPGVVCLLDFYVSEELQRSGIGKMCFDKVLEQTNLEARQLAYDRPSPKLVSFLAKHYQLVHGDLQPNRFMIFEGFIKPGTNK